MIITIVFSCKKESEKDRIVLPKGIKTINKASDQIAICTSCENKLVIFHDFSRGNLLPFEGGAMDWRSFSKEFQKIAVIVYFSGGDEDLLIKKLKKIDFPYEVYFDSEYRFFKENKLEEFPYEYKTHFGFHVKGEKLIGLANTGIPEKLKQELQQ